MSRNASIPSRRRKSSTAAPRPLYRPTRKWMLAVTALTVVLLGAVLYVTALDPLLSWVLAVSAVAFVLFGYDKRRAQQGGGRVPEIVLHLVGWAGGAAGALLGMRVWQHKTRHAAFWISQLGALIIWAGVLVAALT